mmetsp:Transcript_112636/g.304095  ORF Transcript_112636/g.304095 Transcript_112636/m.304095 type:complete len:383 (-) Transcript_112636:255-1403(-)
MLRQASMLLHRQPHCSHMAKLAEEGGGLPKHQIHELFCEDSLRVIGSLLRTTAQSIELWADHEDYGTFLVRACTSASDLAEGWYHDDSGRTMYFHSSGHDPNTSSVQYVSMNISDDGAGEVSWQGTVIGDSVKVRNDRGVQMCGHIGCPSRSVQMADGEVWHRGRVSFSVQAEFMRLFTMIHAEHTAASVVTHATALLASAWCDPFAAYAAGILGFAGPLHGRANQEFVRMLKELRSWLGTAACFPSRSTLQKWVDERLAAGKMVYGFGCKHPYPDPRYSMTVDFVHLHQLDCPNKFPMTSLALHLGRELPTILRESIRAVNPFPNPDAISGVLLDEILGMTDETQHPAMLAQARAIGALATASWHRALGLPIERPQSVRIP